VDTFVPTHPPLRRVWKKLNEGARTTRVLEAQRRERILKAVARKRKRESERDAIKRLGEGVDRSTFRRWQDRYRLFGFDGLVDTRLPPRSPETPAAIREVICTLRRADPQCAVEAIIAHVAKHHEYDVGATMVKEVLVEAGLARRRGPPSKLDHVGEVRLELAGMKLIEAAAVQTGYLEALTKATVERGAAARALPGLPAVDTRGRDEFGRFESEFNERYLKKEGDAIAPGYASVETTRVGKDPDRFHMNQVGADIIERKLWALMVSPLLGSGHWDGIRVSRGDLLGELCGYPYMPSTLDLFTRELKFLGVANTWWEVHARLWLRQTKAWGDPRSAAVLYVDGTNKPVWTEMFSQSTKVSSNGRVMPALETVAFHSGYGVPLWQVTHSGRAPLVREVPALLTRLEGILEGAEVGRIVIIDAEGNSIPFLKGLELGTPNRSWVTRLRPSWVENKRIFNRTNYHSYRDGDRIRMGVADFEDPDDGTFRMRVIEIERRSKKTVTYLGASTRLAEKEWSASELADLYFDRWPNQEADFRAVNQAVGSKDVHGYGKQLVDNVSVVTELDELHNELEKLAATAQKQQADIVAATQAGNEARALLGRREQRLATVTKTVDAAIADGARITPALQRASVERASLHKEISRQTASLARQEDRLHRLEEGRTKTQRRIDKRSADQETLKSRREIFRHDVELDSIFGVLKVGLVLLVTYVLKQYLEHARMEPVTFLERVATLPGRLRMTPDLEIVTFEYNHRDPEVMALIAAHAEAINGQRLRTRSGRVLRIAVEAAPKPRRPPPPRARVNTARRFQR
jgi:transposase